MPANGTVTLAVGKVSQSKSKGKAFVEELNRDLSPESLNKKQSPKPELKKSHKLAI